MVTDSFRLLRWVQQSAYRQMLLSKQKEWISRLLLLEECLWFCFWIGGVGWGQQRAISICMYGGRADCCTLQIYIYIYQYADGTSSGAWRL